MLVTQTRAVGSCRAGKGHSLQAFAIIAYLPNLDGNGHLLLLQGLDVAGTQATAETLIHPEAIELILQRATRPDGPLRSFEILVRSSSIESESGRCNHRKQNLSELESKVGETLSNTVAADSVSRIFRSLRLAHSLTPDLSSDH